MAEKTLKTRILLRNDSAANWEANKTTVLKKGEIGIEIDTNKMKIGDGVTAYGNLKYFGGEAALNFEVFPKGETTDIEAINAAVGDTEIHNGDTAIVKRDIAGGKSSYTAYVYDGEWKAMDGNYRADNVYFDEDLIYTANIGVKTVPSSGSGTIDAAGKNVEEVLKSILAAEKNPSNTKPSVSFSTQSGFGTFEIGTKKNLTYTAALSAGSYTYGPATGITAQSWEVSCTGVEGSKDTATGTFENVIAESTAKKITAKANYNEGAIPKTNLGNPYPNAKIAAGSASKDSNSLIGVRHMFYGVLKSDAVLDSSVIRRLNHEAADKKTITTFGAGAGAVKVVIACPAGYNVTKVLMPSAMNADATANFVKQAGTVNVEGAEGYTAVPYTIWMYKPASIDASETYAVTIG
jgi:hypothetical protein